MLRGFARRLTLAVANVGIVRRAAVEMLAVRQAHLDAGFAPPGAPRTLNGFEDLTFLLSSNVLNHRAAGLRLDEAAHLYRLGRSLPAPATVAEIGRFYGGSTLLLAASLTDGDVYSYDLDPRYGRSGRLLDVELTEALRRYGLEERVTLIIADSRTAEPPTAPCDLVFVDGDHTYAGVQADYDHWLPFIRPGGHLVFHDAVSVPDLLPSASPGVSALVSEIERDGSSPLERRPAPGSLAHFVRV